MMRLENISIGHRVAITVVIVLVALFALALYGYLTGAWDEYAEQRGGGFFDLASAQTRPEPPCMDEQTREQIRAVMLEALDTSLKTHIEHVFEIWLRDERGQPGRARTGVELGLRSYLSARKNTLEWAPPACSG